MAEALIAALMTERSLLRKEIRRAQGENQALSQRADGLEVHVRTLEEAVEDRAGARWAVQEASAAQLEEKTAAQRDWNMRAEAKRQALASTLDRKRQSLAWMRESGAHLQSQLAMLMDGLQQDIAMHRSEELSDGTSLGQLDTRLAHRQFALLSLATEQTRHAEALRALRQFTIDQRLHVQECAASKLSALERERVRVARNLQAAKEMTEQKRGPHPEKQLQFGASRAQLATCMYTSRASTARSGVLGDQLPSPEGANSSGCFHHKGSRQHQSDGYMDDVDPEAIPQSYERQSDVYSVLDALVVPMSRVPALRTNPSRDDAASVVLHSNVSTPRFSRGPTPRTATPRMTTAVRASPTTKAKTAIKPTPQKVQLQPADAVQKGMASHNRALQQPSPSPEPPAPSQPPYNTMPPPRAEALPSDVAARSAVSLKHALHLPPPLLSRMALHRGVRNGNTTAKTTSTT